ncbi:MAG: hypothetical protein QN183_14280 [Armatimonadota bacterium]|nr:hypothetical protein [Armatimonadota bacterium]MDR7485794.1 hypothetical protein [Armatimonadota bacterium]MDR7532090.1 hypothetical protein [Armatimonadota bacterium]MDR7537514.1 hypothetical protein [Armatimonadota bacterium]
MADPRAAGFVVVLASAALAAHAVPRPAQGQASQFYEVWTIDQADAARGGARLYIYDGARLEAGQVTPTQVVDLTAAAAGVGDGPGVRPHMLAFNPTFTHGIIANVASGHVQIVRARDRRVVASIDVGEQAHHAEASPDGQVIVVANQNGKRLARIRADFATERFVYDRGDDLNLAALEGPAQPDNAPICPLVTAGKAYVTVRGGGLYIVDYRATPMRVVRAYGRDAVAPAGCGGAVVGSTIFINSGTATSSDLYAFDAATDGLQMHLRLSWTGSDGHGLVVTGAGRYLWMGNRADHNIVAISVERKVLAGFITGFGEAPDIMAASPSGRHVFVALRGPNNLTGGPTAKGSTPGLAVVEVTDGGRGGRRVAFAPIGDQSPASSADPHTVGVRPVRSGAR